MLDFWITFFHKAPKTETYSIKNQNHPDIEEKTSTRVAFPTVTFNQQPNNWKGKQVRAKIKKLEAKIVEVPEVKIIASDISLQAISFAKETFNA